MAVPVAIYLAFNAGRPAAHGWGVAMSTDTAFALGMLALVGPRFPDRLRSFMLTVVVVDDLVALWSSRPSTRTTSPCAAAGRASALFAVVLVVARARACRRGLVYAAARRRDVGRAVQVGRRSRRHRARDGPARRTRTRPRASELERASDLFRLFREQPTAELARSARAGVESAVSPNERLQQLYHPWTSYVIVPLFALANAGIAINGGFLSRAFTSPITLGILVGYVVGKPVGHRRHRVARDAADARPAAAAGRLGGRRGRRRDRGHRLHGLAPDRDARLQRRAARGGEARRAAARRSSPRR